MGSTRDFPALGFDPAPGDVGAVQSAADSFTSAGKTVVDAHDTASSFQTASGWTGDAATSAQQQVTALGAQIGDHRSDMENAGKVLGQWASDLSGMQSKAGQLESDAQTAQQSLQSAQANPNLNLAGQTFDNQSDAQTAQQNYQGAVSGVQQAQSSLDSLKQQAKQLLDQHKTAAQAVAKALGTGSSTQDKSKTDQSKTDQSKTDQSKTDQSKTDQSKTGTDTGGIKSGQAIDTSQVTYDGSGKYNSGKDAVDGYIDQALDAKGITDPTARANWKAGLETIASRESAYNSPDWQVNTNDSNATGANASDGYPGNSSRGGWQTIPSTFAQYHQPGTSNDIYDPVANAASAINYIQSQYGVSDDGSNLASNVQQADPSRDPHGY